MIDIQKVTWADVKNYVYRLNKKLAKICDQISPSSKHTLFRIKYPYGTKIVDTGTFNIPSNGKIIPLTEIDKEIRDKLNYCQIPLSLILHNSNEVFVESSDRVIPLNFFKEGDLFGIFETAGSLAGTHLNSIWSVTAGARSVFMIPKISDKNGHGRIKKEFGIFTEAPTNFFYQWETFKEIANKSDVQWYNEILVFTKSWFDIEPKNNDWLKFHQYIFRTNWKQSKLLMDSIKFGLSWSSFSEIISKKCLKPRPYIVDTVKHLVSIANGSGVAFVPAVNESALPVSIIQDIYINIYKLKTHIPTIMQPHKLDEHNQHIYYSLAYPTTLETSPFTRNAPSIIDDEREIRLLIYILLNAVNNKNSSKLISSNINYQFFHVDQDKYGELITSNNIQNDDQRFNYCALNEPVSRSFCANSIFFRGCIRVST